MLTPDDIFTFSFTPEEEEILLAMAGECWLGSDDGQHATKGTQQLDPSQYKVDQITGQYGELALHQLVFGRMDGLERYVLQREQRNANKYAGDHGSDLWFPELPGYRADAKTSLMRANRDPLSYTLIVRPRDLHEDTDYVLLLRPKADEPVIKLIGWCNTNELPKETNTSGVFAGAYTRKGKFLRSMEELLIKISARLPD